MTRNVKFTGIQPLDENGYIRINFTGGVFHDVDLASAINTDYLTIGDIIEEIELTVIMSEATYSKAEGKKLAEALVNYLLKLNSIEQSDTNDVMECAKNPYIATWTANGTYNSCRFSNKKEALNWARAEARDNRQWRGTADFHVYNGKEIIYKATIWQDGKTAYYINNGVQA